MISKADKAVKKSTGTAELLALWRIRAHSSTGTIGPEKGAVCAGHQAKTCVLSRLESIGFVRDGGACGAVCASCCCRRSNSKSRRGYNFCRSRCLAFPRRPLRLGPERRRKPDRARPDGGRQCKLHPDPAEERFADRLHGYFEADKGRVGFYLDTVWAKLGFGSSSTSLRNPIAGLQVSTSSNTAVTYSFAIIEAGGLYEIARWPGSPSGSPGSFTALDGLLGFRY